MATIDPNGGADYGSISAAEAGEQSGSAGPVAFDLLRDGPSYDTTAVVIAGWSAGRYPVITVNASYRHEGKYADQRSDSNYVYRLEPSGAPNHIIETSVASVVIDGLCFTGSIGQTCVTSSGTGTVVKNCIAHNITASSARGNFRVTANDLTVRNCVVSNGTNRGILCYSGTMTVQNCSIIASGTYGTVYREGGTCIVQNTYAMCTNGSTAAYYGTFDGASDYNVGDDTSAPGANSVDNFATPANYFVDYSNGDLHLKDTSANLFGISGIDLSGTFTTDIDGDTRSAWDIGADEYAAGEPPGVVIPIIMQHMDHFGGGVCN